MIAIEAQPSTAVNRLRTLAELFDERIDLVSIAGVRNRFFQTELDRTRLPLSVAA